MKALTMLFALVFSTVTLPAEKPKAGWSDNYDKSLAAAKTENKMVLLDFTGSDWCPWCMKLDKEVFSTDAFKSFAKDNLVLVEVDFPQSKRLTFKVKKQNDALKEQYQITGYPTVIVLNSDGQKIGELGYTEGGADVFVARLEKLKAK